MKKKRKKSPPRLPVPIAEWATSCDADVVFAATYPGHAPDDLLTQFITRLPGYAPIDPDFPLDLQAFMAAGAAQSEALTEEFKRLDVNALWSSNNMNAVSITAQGAIDAQIRELERQATLLRAIAAELGYTTTTTTTTPSSSSSSSSKP